MRLKTIKLAGFKSFVDPTTVSIQSNLTGIVGPNGCGKSNIIDAVRWVTGESSAKHLRGESLNDVIFNGSTGRKPVGQAAIELVFDNSDGSLGGEYAQYGEIAVRRELNRDGQSHFYLNGTRCRRRDITDVFLGTGLGPRSYAIIEQGMISQIIDAKPDDIRVYLEEAAGISKYKERRRETENRIRHTRENLERLTDVREEIDKQLSHLKRQANAAERYKVLKQEQRLLKAQLQALLWRSLEDSINEQQLKLGAQETQLEGKIAEHRRIDTDLEKARLQQTERNEVFNEVQGRYYQIGSDIARQEQSIQHIQERLQQLAQDLAQLEESWREADQHLGDDQAQIEELEEELITLEPQVEELNDGTDVAQEYLSHAEQQMAEWQMQWDAFNGQAAKVNQAVEVEHTRVQHVAQRVQGLNQRIQRLQEQRGSFYTANLPEEIEQLHDVSISKKEQIDTLQISISELNHTITQQRQYNAQSQSQGDALRKQLQGLHNQKAQLDALQSVALGKTDSDVSAWLQQQHLHNKPRLGESLYVETGWETAVETVLSPYLEGICVDGFTELTQAIASFAKGKLMLINTQASAALPGTSATLASKVTSEWNINALLAPVYIADDMDQALMLLPNLQPQQSVITCDGIWLSATWLRISKASDEKTGVLQRKQELEGLNLVISEQQLMLEQYEEQVQAGREKLMQLEESRDHAQQQFRDYSTHYNEAHAQLTAKQARLEQLRQRAELANQELSELQQQLQEAQQQHVHNQDVLTAAETQKQQNDIQKNELLQKRDSCREQLHNSRQQAHFKKQQLDECQVRLSSTRNQLHYLKQNIIRTEKQLQQLQDRRETLQKSIADIQQPLPELKTQLANMLEKRLAVEAELSAARSQLQAIEHELRELERQRTRVEDDVSSLRNQLEQTRVAQGAMQVRRDTHLEQINAAGCELTQLLQEMPEEATSEAWQSHIEQLDAKIQRLGPINLAAIEEYDQLAERKMYLDSQNADLLEALNTLEEAIRKIDKESRARLRETYDKANEGFSTLFPKVFGGGSACLELTDDDVLNTGIVIKAQPPGKRNSTIHLLSGGEKALTAIALVFSFFNLNPAPFCILDEVDAPLDEANVNRFCNLVKEMAQKIQFIFISHNKVTMEMAQQLAGVTMNEPGVSRLVSVDIDEAIAMSVN